MNRLIILIAIATFMSYLSGCATVISGTTQSVTIDSNPQGAEVSIDGGYIGVTPITIKLEKNKKDNISLKKEGYKSVSRDLTKNFDPVAIVNIVWDLSTTDFITGAAMKYDPNMYFFELQSNNNN